MPDSLCDLLYQILEIRILLVYILVRNFNKIILLYAFHNSYLHTMTCNMHGETRIYTKLCLKVFTGRKQWGIWYRWDIYIFWDCLL